MGNSQNAFIKIGETRIKLTNIKNYGISEEKHEVMQQHKQRVCGEYRRKIWLSDYAHRLTFSPKWKEFTDYIVIDLDTIDPYIEGSFLSDQHEWKGINIENLKAEYKNVKSATVQKAKEKIKSDLKKNIFSGFVKNLVNDDDKIKAELSEYEAVVKVTDFDNIPDVMLTKGKLYFDGCMLRCEGSPFHDRRETNNPKTNQIKIEYCDQDRILEDTNELLKSGELIKIEYDEAKEAEYMIVEKPMTVKTRYLYITTYQNDNFTFKEGTYNVDAILKKLDDNLTV